MAKHYNVLFLCTGNSARSIMAEAILNRKGKSTFTAYSAGSQPTGKVRPEALKQLELAELPTNQARSKGWEEFSKRVLRECISCSPFATVPQPKYAQSGRVTL
jgi:arsenate reductase